MGFGEAGLLESPVLADIRRPFLQGILRQRAAAHGMRAVLSSCIELHEHQIETAWRVLQDPVQRYLLADEVGLGKTIEAGIVIRQMLLDNPDLARPVGASRHSWSNSGSANSAKSSGCTTSRAPISGSGATTSLTTGQPADLLVVDEAHNLARLSVSEDDALAARFDRLAEVAHRDTAPVNALGDTGVAQRGRLPGHAQTCSTRPCTPTRRADELRARLEARAGLGRIFLGLQPGLPGVLLKGRLAEIEAEFPDDAELAEIVARAGEAVGAQDKDRVATEIQALRTHVAEVYRVHRRMLRTRRTAALEGSYRVTGRAAPEELVLGIERPTRTSPRSWTAGASRPWPPRRATPRLCARPVAPSPRRPSLTLDPAALQAWANERAASGVDADEQAALKRIDAGPRASSDGGRR